MTEGGGRVRLRIFTEPQQGAEYELSLIHISEPTRP